MKPYKSRLLQPIEEDFRNCQSLSKQGRTECQADLSRCRDSRECKVCWVPPAIHTIRPKIICQEETEGPTRLRSVGQRLTPRIQASDQTGGQQLSSGKVDSTHRVGHTLLGEMVLRRLHCGSASQLSCDRQGMDQDHPPQEAKHASIQRKRSSHRGQGRPRRNQTALVAKRCSTPRT